MSHHAQLALDLPLPPSYSREDFLVSPSNAEAFDLFERWPNWPDRVLLLIGPAGAGKSHLASIWAARSRARYILPADVALADLAAADVPAAVPHAYLIEDADRSSLDEAGFFHFLNKIRAGGHSLTITARRPPALWDLATADLLSRLRLAPAVAIDSPDDALIHAVLVKLFVDRQIGVDTTVVDYLATRLERSLEAAQTIVEALDREGLARGHRVTRHLAAEVLRRFSTQEAEHAPAGDRD